MTSALPAAPLAPLPQFAPPPALTPPPALSPLFATGPILNDDLLQTQQRMMMRHLDERHRHEMMNLALEHQQRAAAIRQQAQLAEESRRPVFDLWTNAD